MSEFEHLTPAQHLKQIEIILATAGRISQENTRAIKENARAIAETRQSIAETNRGIDRLRNAMAETIDMF